MSQKLNLTEKEERKLDDDKKLTMSTKDTVCIFKNDFDFEEFKQILSQSNKEELPELESLDFSKETEHVLPPVKITDLEPALKHFLTKPGEGFAFGQDNYIELLNEREGDIILDKIDQNNLKPLYRCVLSIIDIVRINEYKENHLWNLKFLEYLIEEYGCAVVFVLNTLNGIDMLKQGDKISQEITESIINLCKKNTPDPLLISNISKFRELQYKEDDIEFTGLEEPFARQYFEYERFRSIFENRLDPAEICSYRDMEKEFEDVRYTPEMNNFLKMKSVQIAKIINNNFRLNYIQDPTEKTKELKRKVHESGLANSISVKEDPLENMNKNIKHAGHQEDSWKSQTVPGHSSNVKPLITYLRFKNFYKYGVEESPKKLDNQPGNQKSVTLEDLRRCNTANLIKLYKKLLIDNSVTGVKQEKKLLEIVDTWLLAYAWEGTEPERNQTLVEVIYKSLPRISGGSKLHMRFAINKRIYNYLYEHKYVS